MKPASISNSASEAGSSDTAKDNNVKAGNASSDGTIEKGDWVCVGPRSSLSSRTPLKIHGRQVTLLRLRRKSSNLRGFLEAPSERWTCIDSICYHAGGPLMQGEVRTVGGRTCIECPWHRYLIDAFTGEGLYMDMSHKYQSKGIRQRIHQVEIRDEKIYVRLSSEGDVASDEYAYVGKYLTPDNSQPVRSLPDW